MAEPAHPLDLAARAAYGAFALSTADRLGALPPWEKLRPADQADWRAVADAVRMLADLRRVTVAGVVREVTWSEQRDEGGMFPGEAGIFRDGDGFRAYAKNGWGGGVLGGKVLPEAEARAAYGARLWEKLTGQVT